MDSGVASRSVPNINILFVYTQEALDQANADGGTIAFSVDNAVRIANKIYLDSQVNATMGVAHITKIPYVESDIFTALQDVKGKSDGKMDEVHALRAQYNADVVCLIVSEPEGFGSAAGVSYYSVINDKEYPELAFLACRRYGDNINALWHEVAHVLGCKHHAGEPGAGAYPYSNGYQFSAEGTDYATLMANGLGGRTIPFFSNPNVLYKGVPMGDAAKADNVGTMNLTAPRVANYGGQLSGANKTPSANAQNVFTIENTPLSITLTGSDPENAPLTFAIDANPSNGTLSNFNQSTGAVTYTPTSGFLGSDTFTFNVSDGTNTSSTAQVNLTVGSSLPEGNSNSHIDSDADGLPDELETAMNSDPNDALSTPTGISAGAPGNLDLLKIQIKLNFVKSDVDSLSIRGTLPVPEGFAVEGQNITVDVGGVIKTFQLDAKGKFKSLTEMFKLRIKARKKVVGAQDAMFRMKIKKSAFGNLLVDENLIGSENISNGPRIVPVIILFNGSSYRSDASLLFRARANKKGIAKN